MKFDFTGLFEIQRVSGNQMTGLCPFHDDRSPSFSANSDTGLWKCFAGCGAGNYEQFLARLRDGGLPTAPTGELENLKSWSSRGDLMMREAYYVYLAVDGKEHLRVNRFRMRDGSKSFSQEYLDSAGGWQSGGARKRLLPYRIQDWGSSSYVVIVEGEKCVDALYGIGICATTFCGGCNGWRDYYVSLFAGRQVLLLPDNDDPGRHLMETVEKALMLEGVSPERIILPGLPEGGDVIDWVKAGNPPQALRAVLKI